MTIVYKRSQKPMLSSTLTDAAYNRLDQQWDLSRRYTVQSSKSGIAQVFIPAGHSHIVNLHKQECTCGDYQMFKSPCRHVIALCVKESKNPWDLVEVFYTLEAYRKTYTFPLPPIHEEDLEELENQPCLPPII